MLAADAPAIAYRFAGFVLRQLRSTCRRIHLIAQAPDRQPDRRSSASPRLEVVKARRTCAAKPRTTVSRPGPPSHSQIQPCHPSAHRNRPLPDTAPSHHLVARCCSARPHAPRQRESSSPSNSGHCSAGRSTRLGRNPEWPLAATARTSLGASTFPPLEQPAESPHGSAALIQDHPPPQETNHPGFPAIGAHPDWGHLAPHERGLLRWQPLRGSLRNPGRDRRLRGYLPARAEHYCSAPCCANAR